MPKFLLTTLLIVFFLNTYAQAPFEPGYLIDNEGNRIECLIKNTDKLLNPTQFEYKLLGNDDGKIASIKEVAEFEIYNTIHKYQRFTVNIDRSGSGIKELGFSGEPEFNEEVLFLRTLIEGYASLYVYNEGYGFERFFYKLNNDAVVQLVYKQYYTSENKIAKNETYKQKLFTDLNCKGISMGQIIRINYIRENLVDHFADYNECMGSEYMNYYARKKKSKIGLKLKAGAIVLTTELDQRVVITRGTGKEREMKVFNYYNEFDKKISPQVGLELELVLPYDQEKWSVFFEPSYQKFKHSFELLIYKDAGINEFYQGSGFYNFSRVSDKGIFQINYSRIALPLGVRHNLYNKVNSKLYIKGAVAFNLLIKPDSALEVESQSVPFINKAASFTMEPGITAGIGYEFKRLSLETSFLFSSATTINNGNYSSWSARFNYPVSMTLGYRLF